MDKALLDYCLSLLDTQYGYTKYERLGETLRPVPTIRNERQDAYYQGMRVMLEVILTSGYAEPGGIVRGVSPDTQAVAHTFRR